MKRSSSASLSLALLVALAAAGCGGDGVPGTRSPASGGRGRINVQIQWPTRAVTRVIPTVTESLKVGVYQGGALFEEKTIASPATTVAFDEIPTGSVEVRAAALKPDAPDLARGSVMAMVVADTAIAAEVTMTSRIAHLRGLVEDGETLNWFVNSEFYFEIMGEDEETLIIPVAGADISWTTSNAAVADVTEISSVGEIKVVTRAAGSATLTFTDRISGKIFSFVVAVA